MFNLDGQMLNLANIYAPTDAKESNKFNWMADKLPNSQWLVCKNSNTVNSRW